MPALPKRVEVERIAAITVAPRWRAPSALSGQAVDTVFLGALPKIVTR
jgi:hypothetical protein